MRTGSLLYRPCPAIEKRGSQSLAGFGSQNLGFSDLFGGGIDQVFGIGNHGQDFEIVQKAEEGTGHLHEIDPAIDGVRYGSQGFCHVLGQDLVPQLEKQTAIRHAQHLGHFGQGQLLIAHIRHHLVEKREPIAYRARRLARHQAYGIGIAVDLLVFQDARKVLGQGLAGEQLEVVALTARHDGRRDLVDLGGGKDEHHMLGRLFQVLSNALKALVESIWTSSMM